MGKAEGERFELSDDVTAVNVSRARAGASERGSALRSALMTRLATFGRVDELAAIEAFLEPVPPGPAAPQIAGAAGIGKTTLLRHAVTTASRRGFTVLRGVASQADSSVSLAVLADVLGEIVDEVRAGVAPR